MCHRAVHTFPPVPESGRAARYFVASTLGAVLCPDPAATPLIQDAVLVVSELLTNAVRAGSTRIDVTVVIHRDQLLVNVGDDAPGLPRVPEPGPLDLHGRGLRVVAALSRAWAVQVTEAGKIVSAEVTIPAALTDSLTCDR